MRSRNARERAVLTLSAVLLGLFALSTTASADDGAPPPRAIPAARALPRSFGSYSDLIAFATDIAATQTALDQRAIEAKAEFDSIMRKLGPLSTTDRRGALFDIDAEARGARSEASLLSVRAVTLWRTLQQLSAAGALTAERTSWRMPTEGEITQAFGPTDLWVEPGRTYGGVTYAHFHDGVDIAGEWMADVVAPARGRVVFVGRMMDGAEVVVLVHDGGLVSMYAHLDAYASPPPVSAGDEVAAGQRIGTVGMTGIVTGAHLHWSVYRAGQLVDPLSLLPN